MAWLCRWRGLAFLFGLIGCAPLALQALENQKLTWLSPTNKILRLHVPQELSATSSSGLSLTYRVLEGPATLQDHWLTITSVASVTVVAVQSGDGTYRPRSLTNRFNENSLIRLTSLGRGSHDSSAFRVKVQGALAYVAERPNGLQIYDVSNRQTPVWVGGIVTGGEVLGLQVRGNYAYLAEGVDGVRVVDISNPAQPSSLAMYDTPGSAVDLDVVNSLAYVADVAGGLQILDVGNPDNPRKVGEYVSSGAVHGVCVVGSVAYLANSATGLRVVDVAVPSAPTELSAFEGIPARSISVDPAGRIALVCGNDGFRLFDISVPGPPVLLEGRVLVPASRGQVRDGQVFVISVGRLQVYTYEGGKLTTQVLQSVATDSPLDVELTGTSAFVASGSGGLEIFDVKRGFTQTITLTPTKVPNPFVFTNAPLPLMADSSSGLPVHFVLEGGPATVESNLLRLTGTGAINLRAEQPGDDLYFPALPKTFVALVEPNQTVSVESPTNRVLALRTPLDLQASATGGGPLTFRVLSGPGSIVGNRLTISAVDPVIVVTEQAGDSVFQPVRVTNIFNSEFEVKGRVLSTLNLPGNARRLELVGSLAYLATGDAGVQIVNVGDPASPVRVGGIGTEGVSKGLQVVGDIAYVADGSAGLQILDVRDPSNPTRLGHVDTPGNAIDVKVSDHYAFVADGTSGFQIVDITDPRNPMGVSTYYSSGNTMAMDVIGSLVYALGHLNGLEIVDVGDPTKPVRVGKLNLEISSTPQAVQISGSTAFLADGSSHLRTINVRHPAFPEQLGIQYGSEASRALRVAGLTAYVVGGTRMDAYDVSVPTTAGLRHLGGVNIGGEPSDIRVSGMHAFVANSSSGLQVIRLEKRLPQTLEFSLPQTLSLTDSPVTLAGTSSSGLPLRYRVTHGPAEVSGDKLILTATGLIGVEASLGGDADHQPSPVVLSWSLVAPPPPRLSASISHEGDRMLLTVQGSDGVRVNLQRSTALDGTRVWETIDILRLDGTPTQIDEELVTTGPRYYRAIEVQ